MFQFAGTFSKIKKYNYEKVFDPFCSRPDLYPDSRRSNNRKTNNYPQTGNDKNRYLYNTFVPEDHEDRDNSEKPGYQEKTSQKSKKSRGEEKDQLKNSGFMLGFTRRLPGAVFF